MLFFLWFLVGTFEIMITIANNDVTGRVPSSLEELVAAGSVTFVQGAHFHENMCQHFI